MDHIGTLPIISKAYPLARIYMTPMTADLTRVLLYDSLKIMNWQENEIPHYTEQDVLDMLSRVTPERYQTPLSPAENLTLTFYPAGHIAGAECIYLVTEEGTLFYSGDFAAFSQRTVEGIHIPKLRPDIAIVEATYGNRLHSNRQVEERRLVELVKECIEKGQKILIPAFALGRAQEVLLILRAAIQNQELPAVPVYADGMVRNINTMYTRNPTFLKNALGKRILKGNEPFYTREIQPVAPNQNREELLARTRLPVVVKPLCGEKLGLSASQRYAIARDMASFVPIYERFRQLAGEPPLVQTYLPGGALGCSVLADHGKLVTAVCHRRIREYPVSGGPSACCDCIDAPQLVDMAAAMVEATQYTGLAMFEFKEDGDGKPHLLEVNPRVWGTYPLTRRSGSRMSLLWAILAHNEGNPDKSLPLPPIPKPQPCRMHFTASDLCSAVGYAKRGQWGRALGTVGDLLRPAVKDGLWEWGDVKPGLLYYRSLLRR